MITTKAIAIASPPGGGKSTLGQQLTKKLHCEIIFYDDYQKATQQSITDISNWMREGSNYNALDIPNFSNTIKKKKLSTPNPWLIIETPLGRHHHDSGQHIDCLIWIDTPFDVALARNILAFSQEFKNSPERITQQLDWLESYTESYIHIIRDTLPIQRQRLKPDADIVLDGTLSADCITQSAISMINEWSKSRL